MLLQVPVELIIFNPFIPTKYRLLENEYVHSKTLLEMNSWC